MVLSLGLVWIFDGYEVSLISLFRSYIVKEHSEATFKSLATSYQIGCIVGSLIFGIAGFGVGRKKIFLVICSLTQDHTDNLCIRHTVLNNFAIRPAVSFRPFPDRNQVHVS